MKERKRIITRVGKVLIWLGLLVFFVYSFRALIEWEPLIDPRRHEAFGRIVKALTEPNLFEYEDEAGEAIVFSEITYITAVRMRETFQIAFLATSFGALLAIPFTFFSARPYSWWQRGFNVLLQPLLAVIRAVHPLITLLFFVVLAGIGSTAGVLALTLFSTAILIEKFSEYAQQNTSLEWNDLIVVHFPGLAFRYFPANILIASILGFMGGGGIGFVLQQEINLLNYRNASVAIFMIILVVGSLDLLSRAVWRKFQSVE